MRYAYLNRIARRCVHLCKFRPGGSRQHAPIPGSGRAWIAGLVGICPLAGLTATLSPRSCRGKRNRCGYPCSVRLTFTTNHQELARLQALEDLILRDEAGSLRVQNRMAAHLVGGHSREAQATSTSGGYTSPATVARFRYSSSVRRLTRIFLVPSFTAGISPWWMSL